MSVLAAITLEDFRPVFDPGQLAQKTGLERDSPRLAKLAQSAAEHCSCSGAALVAGVLPGPDEAETDIGGIMFTSALLRQKLSGLDRAFPYLATEGAELAAWGASHKNGEDAAIVHAIRQLAVKETERELEKRLCEKFGIPLLSAMNPGSLKDWPLDQQAILFGIFGELPQKMGVSILPSNIMQPDYTVSGVFFQTDKKFYNCQLCPRENCPNRKAKAML